MDVNPYTPAIVVLVVMLPLGPIFCWLNSWAFLSASRTLIPSIDALLHSTRQSADPAFAFMGSLHPLNLVQLVAPYMFVNRVVGQNTHELGLYLGAVPLMLIVWLVVQWKELGSLKNLAASVSLFAALSLLLAFGRYGQLYDLMTYMPLVGDFRFPSRYLVLFQLAAAVLAALGFLLLCA